MEIERVNVNAPKRLSVCTHRCEKTNCDNLHHKDKPEVCSSCMWEQFDSLKSEHEAMVEKIRNLPEACRHRYEGQTIGDMVKAEFPQIFPPEPVKSSCNTAAIPIPPKPQAVYSTIIFPANQDRIAISRAILDLLKDGWKFSCLSERGIEFQRSWHYPDKAGNLQIQKEQK